MRSDARIQRRPGKPSSLRPFLTTNHELRTTNCRPGFTLIEALVSIAIAAGMLVMIATIFRQSTQVTRRTLSSARVHQTARQVFEQIGRDLAGIARDGFLVIRAQSREVHRGASRSKISLYYDEDGQLNYLTDAHTDMLVLAASGYHLSAVDHTQVSNFSRIIWGQTERVNGSDNELAYGRSGSADPLDEHPEWLGVNQVLARNQTLLQADGYSVDARSYSGYNRGPDYYNMGLHDLSRYFWVAMGAHSSIFLYGRGWGDDRGGSSSDAAFLLKSTDLVPYKQLSKVFRLGRNGRGPGDIAAGNEGAGDLTDDMVHCEPPVHMIDSDPYVSYSYSDMLARPNGGYRGHQRTRIYGPKDYHRIMAFGCAVFQVDWSDGRRRDGKLVFYPRDSLPSAQYIWDVWGRWSRTWRNGPGEVAAFAWNRFSPRTVRQAQISGSKQTSGWHSYNSLPWGSTTSGSRGIGRAGWSWPKAIRVRIVLMDHTTDPPTPFSFSQVFTLLAQ